jgi:Phage integrase, N-terminal SAM-like domain
VVWSPQVRQVALEGGSGERFVVGHWLVDGFLEFAASRGRPNTVRAYAHDLKAFFAVVAKDPVEVRPADVLLFISSQRRARPGAEKVVRIADASAGLSAATVRRRSAAVSAFYGYLVTRGDVGVEANPVPRGLPARGPRRDRRGRPLVRAVRQLPRILGAEEMGAFMSALRTQRDRAMVQGMALGGLRRAEVLGLRLEDLRLGEWRVFVNEGKGGPPALSAGVPRLFRHRGFIYGDRAATGSGHRPVVRSAEGLSSGPGTVERRPGRGHFRGPGASRSGPWHLPRAAPHLPHPLARGGDVDRGLASPSGAPLDRLDPAVLAPGGGLAGRRVPPGGGGRRSPGISGGVVMSALVASQPACRQSRCRPVGPALTPPPR